MGPGAPILLRLKLRNVCRVGKRLFACFLERRRVPHPSPFGEGWGTELPGERAPRFLVCDRVHQSPNLREYPKDGAPAQTRRCQSTPVIHGGRGRGVPIIGGKAGIVTPHLTTLTSPSTVRAPGESQNTTETPRHREEKAARQEEKGRQGGNKHERLPLSPSASCLLPFSPLCASVVLSQPCFGGNLPVPQNMVTPTILVNHTAPGPRRRMDCPRDRAHS